ncbi:IclR family transcriptional regulator [Streptacidiphilus monticola]|uniref:IclR family transcriptional regulator n=1 Tax=Streptacidiphilus monticola TaxID=2161674 RepID=A0ABW1G325_9ACTN
MPASATTAVEKALDLAEAVARAARPPRLSEIADALGMNRATAYRVLADLVKRGWVLRLDDRYLPGPVLLQLADVSRRRSLTGLARPVLAELSDRTGMMANVQVLAPGGSRVLDVVRPDALRMISDLRGELLPPHRFAGPLALVAALPEGEREPYLRAAGEDGADPDGLRQRIERAVRDGHAVQRGRAEELVGSAARVVTSAAGTPVCALALVGPAREFTGPRLRELLAELERCAARLGTRLTELTQPQEYRD